MGRGITDLALKLLLLALASGLLVSHGQHLFRASDAGFDPSAVWRPSAHRSERESPESLEASYQRLRDRPADAHTWHRHARLLLRQGHFGEELSRSVQRSLELAPWARDIRLEQALLSLRRYHWVEPDLQQLWQDNLARVLQNHRQDFLVEAGKRGLELQVCNLAPEPPEYWCDRVGLWREHCAADQLRPKWQRFCGKLEFR